MHKRLTVKPSTKLQLFKNFNTFGHSLDEAPQKAKNSLQIPVSELFDINFGVNNRNRADYFFMPGKHREKIYRYQVNDTDFDHKDEYDFFLIPIDIDLHTKDGREVWKDDKEAKHVIDHMRKTSNIIGEARGIASSRGGVRAVYVCEKTVNSLEWRSLYANTVKEIAADLSGEFGKYGKMTFTIDDFTLVLDGRNPGSLTRVPFGFREGRPVRNASYFYQVQTDNYLKLNRFGKLQEFEKQYRDISGFDLVDLSPEMRKKKSELPKENELAKLPVGISPFQWHSGPPKQGEREIAIFHAVSNAKQEYKDSLTPEQYYSYFYNAIILEMDTSKASIPAEVQLWSKIVRNWYVRSEAKTYAGKKLDTTNFRNSGGRTFFKGKDFDRLKSTKGLFEYAKTTIKGYASTILKAGQAIVFLNTPPGSGKSTAAVDIFQAKPSLYIALSYENLRDFKSKLGRMEVNEVLSYKALIPIVTEDKKEQSELLELYNEYDQLYKNSPKELILPRRKTPMAFWEFISARFPEIADLMSEENESRIALFRKGKHTIMTKGKFLTLVARADIQKLPSSYQFIFDEVTPEDIINPDIFVKSKKVQVYGEVCEPAPLELKQINNQYTLKSFMENRLTILINADKGLEKALKYNGYANVKVYGNEMRDVLDNDVCLVFSPYIKSGYLEFKPEYEHDELSTKVLMVEAAETIATLNKEALTTITNGTKVNGEKISEYNNTNVIGLNKFSNSRVASFHTCLTPDEIANACFCIGLKPEQAEDLVFQNRLNQIIGRNTGYRSFDAHIDWLDSKTKERPKRKENIHYVILPEKYLTRDIDLICKTVNTFTTSSKKIPKEIEVFLKPTEKSITERLTMYKIEPGTAVKASVIAEKLKMSVRKLKIHMKENKALFPDYSYRDRFRLDNNKTRDVIYRERNIREMINETLLNTFSNIKLSQFIKNLKKISTEEYIERMTIKSIKKIILSSSHSYDLRIVSINHVEHLCPTDEDFTFREII